MHVSAAQRNCLKKIVDRSSRSLPLSDESPCIHVAIAHAPYNSALFLLVFLDVLRSRQPAQSHGVPPRSTLRTSDRPAKIDSSPRNEINKNERVDGGGGGGDEQVPSAPHVPFKKKKKRFNNYYYYYWNPHSRVNATRCGLPEKTCLRTIRVYSFTTAAHVRVFCLCLPVISIHLCDLTRLWCARARRSVVPVREVVARRTPNARVGRFARRAQSVAVISGRFSNRDSFRRAIEGGEERNVVGKPVSSSDCGREQTAWTYVEERPRRRFSDDVWDTTERKECRKSVPEDVVHVLLRFARENYESGRAQ